MARTTQRRPGFKTSLRELARPCLALFTIIMLLPAMFGYARGRFLSAGWAALRGAGNAAQGNREIRRLEAGKPIEQELSGGQAHFYQISLTSGQYLRLVVDQQGIDVLVILTGPDGKALAEVDRPIGPQGPEPVSFAAAISGAYGVEVRAAEKEAPAGRYKINVAELRETTAQDRGRIDGERAFFEGEKLQAEATADSLAQAIKKYEQALGSWQTLGDRQRQADTLYYLGSIYESLGNKQKALNDYYGPALKLFQDLRDQIKEADMLTNIGKVYDDLGEKRKALGYFDQSLNLYRALKSPGGEAAALNNAGKVYDDLGDKQKSLEYYNRALGLFQALKAPDREAVALNNIGGVYDSLDERQKALEYYNRALPLFQAAGDRGGEATALNNIGKFYDDLGEKERALDLYNRAAAIFRATSDRQREANTLSNIGGVYDFLDKRPEAINNYDRALAISREVGDRKVQVYTLAKVGKLYDEMADEEIINSEMGDRQKAEEGKKKAVAYKQKALGYYVQALPISRALGDRAIEAYTLTNTGKVHDDLEDNRKALDYYNQALPIHLALSDSQGEAYTRYHIARVQRDLNSLTEARNQIVPALNIVESLRTKMTTDQQLRASYFATVQNYYELYIDLLMLLHKERPSEGNDAKALQIGERARARSLLELLSEARANIRRGADPALLERERLLQQKLNDKAQRQIRLLNGSHTEGQAATVKKEIDALKDEYRQVEEQMRAKSPRYAALTQPQPLSSSEMQQQVLDPDTLLLEFSLGRLRSYVWAVTPTSITSFELPRRYAIEAAARRYYELLAGVAQQSQPPGQDRGLRVDTGEARRLELAQTASALSQMLLSPVASQLGKKRLLIVAGGALQYVPFAALPDPVSARAGDENKQPLIVDHEVVSLPSASTIAALRKELAGRKPAAKSIAVIADPVFDASDERVAASGAQRREGLQPSGAAEQRGLTIKIQKAANETGVKLEEGFSVPRLPGTRKEAEGILAFDRAEQTMQAFDFKANLATATSAELRQYRYLHFATHGFLNSAHPELSGILLSLVNEKGEPQNGFLLANEIYNLDLPAEMVVLSACKTGLGKEVKGEGIVGLTRGLMYAGAARVIVSLWSVDDDATAELMTSLYKGVLKDGMQPAAALRAAQVAMWKQKRWQSPYFWAAFVLQGEWR